MSQTVTTVMIMNRLRGEKVHLRKVKFLLNKNKMNNKKINKHLAILR